MKTSSLCRISKLAHIVLFAQFSWHVLFNKVNTVGLLQNAAQFQKEVLSVSSLKEFRQVFASKAREIDMVLDADQNWENSTQHGVNHVTAVSSSSDIPRIQCS